MPPVSLPLRPRFPPAGGNPRRILADCRRWRRFASAGRRRLPLRSARQGRPSAIPRRPECRARPGRQSRPYGQDRPGHRGHRLAAQRAGPTLAGYDISPYTLRVTTTNRPEQAIVDWILRETGYEAWHSEPLGILSATRRELRVYHTPAMQAVVADIVDRFVGSEAETQAFSLRVVTLDSPTGGRGRSGCCGRAGADAGRPGLAAWRRKTRRMLLADLRRRSDYREHSSPHLLVNNGQSTVVSAMRGRNYVRDVILRPETWPGFEPETGRVDEGFSLEFSPLLSLDGRMIDATIKCDIDQVEKMVAGDAGRARRVAPRGSAPRSKSRRCPFPLPRAVPLAGGPGAAGGHGHGGRAGAE